MRVSRTPISSAPAISSSISCRKGLIVAAQEYPPCPSRDSPWTERADSLRQVFAEPLPLLEGERTVGDPIAVLPTLYHLLWTHTLVADLDSAPLSASSVVEDCG